MKSNCLPVWILCVAMATGLDPQTTGAERYVIREVMSGLVAPRGMAIGPDGGLYARNRATSAHRLPAPPAF
jgi:hypothetical protein